MIGLYLLADDDGTLELCCPVCPYPWNPDADLRIETWMAGIWNDNDPPTLAEINIAAAKHLAEVHS